MRNVVAERHAETEDTRKEAELIHRAVDYFEVGASARRNCMHHVIREEYNNRNRRYDDSDLDAWEKQFIEKEKEYSPGE